MEVVASLSQGRTAAAQCGFFTYKSVPVIFEPPCNSLTHSLERRTYVYNIEGGGVCVSEFIRTPLFTIHKLR